MSRHSRAQALIPHSPAARAERILPGSRRSPLRMEIQAPRVPSLNRCLSSYPDLYRKTDAARTDATDFRSVPFEVLSFRYFGVGRGAQPVVADAAKSCFIRPGSLCKRVRTRLM